jgi:hypothetical protein
MTFWTICILSFSSTIATPNRDNWIDMISFPIGFRWAFFICQSLIAGDIWGARFLLWHWDGIHHDLLREILGVSTPKTIRTERCPQKENCVLVADQKVAIFGKDEVWLPSSLSFPLQV